MAGCGDHVAAGTPHGACEPDKSKEKLTVSNGEAARESCVSEISGIRENGGLVLSRGERDANGDVVDKDGGVDGDCNSEHGERSRELRLGKIRDEACGHWRTSKPGETGRNKVLPGLGTLRLERSVWARLVFTERKW